jgi:hypothetical protein
LHGLEEAKPCNAFGKNISKKGRRAGISLPARIMKKIFLAIFFTLSLYPGNMKKP